MLGIIPSAGFGTRVDMASSESKELLWDKARGQRLIDFSINLCHRNKITPLVVTREEKKDLIDYCLNQKKTMTLLIEPKGEWTNTVLATKELWHDENFLIFPDAIFSPADITISDMQQHLDRGEELSVATHEVKDPSKWLVVDKQNLREKDKALQEGSWEAVGIVGFKKHVGESLFLALRDYGVSPTYYWKTSYSRLRSFEDLTREKNENLERKAL